MNQYKLTFTMTFKEQDDPAARKKAKEISATLGKTLAETEVKLQQVYMDQSPRGVRLD